MTFVPKPQRFLNKASDNNSKGLIMVMRRLTRSEIETIWTIDRREIHHHIYQWQNGELVLISAFFDIQGWPPGKVEHGTPQLYTCFDRGGSFFGVFDGNKIVGAAVLDSILFGSDRDYLQLRNLYVSRDFRRTGVGTKLFEAAKTAARERGARLLYISATPTQNTVDFYRRRGAVIAEVPDLEMLALEPDDIHLICPV